jgi:hypothetical protein
MEDTADGVARALLLFLPTRSVRSTSAAAVSDAKRALASADTPPAAAAAAAAEDAEDEDEDDEAEAAEADEATAMPVIVDAAALWASRSVALASSRSLLSRAMTRQAPSYWYSIWDSC